MKRTRTWLLLGSLALAAAGGCGKAASEPQLGGETHWLQRCSADGADVSECGPELQCVCGVCSRACETDAECAGVSTEGRCSARQTTQYASACRPDAPQRLCVRAPTDTGSPTPRLGRRYDATRSCYGALELAGDSSEGAAQACLYPNVIGIRAGGECWQFPDGCLPDGFEDANQNPLIDPLPCPYAERLCPEELSCSPGEAPTQDGCLSCDDARQEHALGTLEYVVRAELDRCVYDTDCVAEPRETGCDSLCPEALNRDFVERFRSQIPPLDRAYCSDPAEWRASCGQRLSDCGTAPLCRNGRCTLAALACEARPLDECESDGDCALARANRFNATSQCFEAATVPVACVDPDYTCPPVTRAAVNAADLCFRFSNCVPPGFRSAPDDHPCIAATASVCEP
jgi:hypothetical protein